MNLDQKYWNDRYLNNQTGWDIGYPSTPIVEYLNQIRDKTINILIPGCGNAYEGNYCHENGFKNTFLLDISEKAIQNIEDNFPNIPKSNIIHGDFFKHEIKYDLIIEQTFFCALNPEMRKDYVSQAAQLLKPNGKLVGLLFNRNFEKQGPPFGGTKKEYEKLFGNQFDLQILEEAKNSIAPRQGNEYFIKFIKH